MQVQAARALGALGRVLWRGLEPFDRDWIDDVPVLRAAMRELGSWDEVAAEHQRVMGTEVLPYASVYASDEALMGGEWAARASAAFRDAGFEPPDPPDAVGALIGLYAGLAEHHPKRAAAMAHQLLTPVVAPVLCATIEEGGPLYPEVARLAAQLLDVHLAEKPIELGADLLDDPKTGLRDIVDHWLIPAHSGVFLSRGAILRLAEASGHPCGFGARKQMLHAWLITAREHQQLPEALQHLDEVLLRWQRRYRTWHASHWDCRLQRTRDQIARVAQSTPIRE